MIYVGSVRITIGKYKERRIIMANVRSVGAYLFNMYKSKYSEEIDELKIQKLLYFSQRESLMLNDKPLFDECFYGWKFGPVLRSVRTEFHNPSPYFDAKDDLTESEKQMLDSVMDRYGGLSSWKLSSLSHAEFSWELSRKGLKDDEHGDNKLDLKAMKIDAARERAHREE